MTIPIAVQLYSVRDDCARDFPSTLRAVAAMGYDGVEFAGFHGASAEDVAAMLSGNGLRCAGNHCGWQNLEADKFDETVAYHRAIGCTNLVVPGLPLEKRATPDACRETAAWLTEVADKLRSHGMRTGYHCHSDDMRPLEDGVSAWYHIARNTPDDFILQYDTSNGMVGGADAVQPLLDFPGRGTTVHVKEVSGEGEANVIGEGPVPWKRVLEACSGPAGTEWLIVEHEIYGSRTPLQGIEACLKNLRAML